MDIRIGVPVRAADGQAGTVERIILHPQGYALEGIVAAQGGMLTRDVVIPADRIEAAEEGAVWVRGTVDDISDLAPYAQSQYVDPPEDWIPPVGGPASFYLFPASPLAVGAFTPSGIQPEPAAHEVEDLDTGELDVSDRTPVYCRDGACGHVERVITGGDSDTVTHLVVNRGTLRGRPVAVPVSSVDRMEEAGVWLHLTQHDLDTLPTFRE